MKKFNTTREWLNKNAYLLDEENWDKFFDAMDDLGMKQAEELILDLKEAGIYINEEAREAKLREGLYNVLDVYFSEMECKEVSFQDVYYYEQAYAVDLDEQSQWYGYTKSEVFDYLVKNAAYYKIKIINRRIYKIK